jgi:hypothetical protein
VVGVWQGDRHLAYRREGWPIELTWYRAHWLPYGDGRRAEVKIHDGVVEIVVPYLDDPYPTPSPPMGAWPATSMVRERRSSTRGQKFESRHPRKL